MVSFDYKLEAQKYLNICEKNGKIEENEKII
jgi:hypothetical protein